MPDSDERQDFNSCVFFKLLTCTFRTFTFVTFYSFLHFLAMGERGFSRNIGTCQLRDFPDLFPTFATFLARIAGFPMNDSGPVGKSATTWHRWDNLDWFASIFSISLTVVAFTSSRDKLKPVGVAITDQDGVVGLTWTTRDSILEGAMALGSIPQTTGQRPLSNDMTTGGLCNSKFVSCPSFI